MAVREASSGDAAELQQIMARTPQGQGFVFAVVNDPDFFARARAYERSAVFVVEEDGAIAGSAAVAVRDLLVGGVPRRVGYEFQYFTSPDHRRRGTAARLRERIEVYLREHGADLTTAIVGDDNPPSLRLFAGQGFRRHRALEIRLMLPLQHLDLVADRAVRSATPDDLPAVARLLSATRAGRDFGPAVTPDRLAGFLRRTPGLGRRRLLLLTERDELVACAGVWDWSRVQRIEVLAVAAEAPAALHPLRPGQRLRQWGLTAIGFRQRRHLATLLGHVNNLAFAAGVEQVGLVGEPGEPTLRALAGFPALTIPAGLYLKPLGSEIAPEPRPVFVDVVDI